MHRGTSEMVPFLSRNIRKYWGRSNLTLEQLAEQSFLSIGTLKGLLYKGERDPRISTLIYLAASLGCTVNDLIGYRKAKINEESGRLLAEIRDMLNEHYKIDAKTTRSNNEVLTEPELEQNIKRYQQATGLSAEQLAEKAFVSVDTLKGILYRGENNPKLSTVINLAVALDCTVNDLIGYKKDKETEESEKVLKEIKAIIDAHFE